MVDLNETEVSFDAQRTAEAVAEGEQNVAEINVSKDYENSKAFDSASSSDAKDVANSNSNREDAPSTDPEEFRSMAKEVNPFIGSDSE